MDLVDIDFDTLWEKFTKFWHQNEFFIYSLGVMGFFIYLLRGGLTSLVFLLFPLSSFFFATFWYSFHDHLTQSLYHTPRFSINPLGNVIVKARWLIIISFSQFLILIMYIFDLQKNESIIDYYKYVYSVLLLLLQFIGLIAIYIKNRSDSQLDIHFGEEKSDLHIKVRTRLSTVFLYSQIILLPILFLIFMIVTLSNPYRGEINSGYALQELTILTPSGVSGSLNFSYFFIILFAVGIISMFVSIGYGYYLYKNLNFQALKRLLQDKGIPEAEWIISFIEKLIQQRKEKKTDNITANQKTQIMDEIARS
ncbi:MAG: hypothetical protein ACTSRK_04940 [Promethearchaeota archaeon]